MEEFWPIPPYKTASTHGCRWASVHELISSGLSTTFLLDSAIPKHYISSSLTYSLVNLHLHTCVFRVVVLLHDPFSVELQFTNGYPDIPLYLLVQSRIHSYVNDGKPSWSRGSKTAPNHDTATTVLHDWDRVLMLECIVCFSPNITLLIKQNILPIAFSLHVVFRKL